MGQIQIAYNVGTIIGDFPTRQSNAFDNTTTQNSDAAAAKGALTGYVGKDWGSGKALTGYRAYGTSDIGFCDGGAVTASFELFGSNNGTDWTTLGTSSMTNEAAAVMEKLTGLTRTSYRYHKLQLTVPAGPSNIFYAEVQFFYSTGKGTRMVMFG